MAAPEPRKPRRVELVATAPLSGERMTIPTAVATAGVEQSDRAGGIPVIPSNYIPDGTGEWDYLLNKWDSSTASHAQISRTTQIDLDRQESTVRPTVYQQLKKQPAADVEDVEDAEMADTANQGRKRRLAQGEAEAIINEMIAEFTEAWNNKDLLRLLPTARASWLSVEDEGGRQQLAQAKGADVEEQRNMVDRACDHILDSEWFSEKSLRAQCKSLEVLVHNLETTSWEHALYQRPSPPSEIDSSMLEDVHDASDDEEADSLDFEPELGELEDDDFVMRDEPSPVRATAPAPTGVIDLGSDSSDEEECGESPIPTISEPVASESAFYQDNFVQIQKQRSSLPTRVVLADRTTQLHHEKPEVASFATVARWRWKDLVDSNDRNRLIMKIIQRMTEEERDMVRDRLSVKKHRLLAEIPDCTHMLLRGERKMPGVLPRDQEKIIKWTRLFLSWWLCNDFVTQDPEVWQLEELAECARGEFPEPGIFYELMVLCMDRTFRKGSYSIGPPPGAEVIVLD